MISTKTAPPMTVPNVSARFVNWGKSALRIQYHTKMREVLTPLDFAKRM